VALMSNTETKVKSPLSPKIQTANNPSSERIYHESRWKKNLSLKHISVLYAEIILVIIFILWAPSTFGTITTLRSILNESAISGMMALAIVLPLSANTFDLSIGDNLTLVNMLVAWLIVDHSIGPVLALICAVVVGLIVGLFNGFIVVKVKINSFIGTLGTGAIYATLATVLSTETITGTKLQTGLFAKFAYLNLGGIDLPVFIAAFIGVCVWGFQRYTVSGRRIYAVGMNERGSELIGIKVNRLRYGTLIICAVIVALAALLLTSSLSSGTPGIGDSYLLSAYAAAYLGSTQFGGRFNAMGALLAVVVLTTGTTGLYLVGAPSWTQTLFTGAVLLIALGASNMGELLRVRSWVRGAKTES